MGEQELLELIIVLFKRTGRKKTYYFLLDLVGNFQLQPKDIPDEGIEYNLSILEKYHNIYIVSPVFQTF